MREMKDSGIAWVGKIPTHWTKKKGKYILRYMSKPVKQDDSVITCFRDGEVTLRSNRREDGFTMADKEIGYQGVDVGDLVVHGMDGFAGAIGISDSRGKASPVLNVLNTKQNKKYIMYYLRSMANGEVFTALSTGIRVRSCDLRWNKLAELLYPLPPIDEQNHIVNYIDEQIARTNEIIADTQAQIDTLEQYKRSVITEAVTHGLNPSAPMKDSGIPWVGKTPEYWKVGRIGGLYELRNQKVSDKDFMPLSVTMKGILPQLETAAKTNDGDNRKLVRVGDFAINSRSDRRGSCGISDYDGSVSLINTILKPRNRMNAKYYNWLFHTPMFADEFYKWGHGIVDDLWTTNWSEMKRISIPLPPLDEQQEIADYLDNKCAEIEQIIADKKSQIETLDGYKKSLIYEYVTGKKEVV